MSTTGKTGGHLLDTKFSIPSLFLVAVFSFLLGSAMAAPDAPDPSVVFFTSGSKKCVKLNYDGEDYFNTVNNRGSWLNSKGVQVEAQGGRFFTVTQDVLERVLLATLSASHGRMLLAQSLMAEASTPRLIPTPEITPITPEPKPAATLSIPVEQRAEDHD